MIYIHRNEHNKITDLKFSPVAGYEEQASLFDEEIKAFLKDANNEALIKETLSNLDLEMVRVIEDMIDLFIDKGLMMFTDLPVPVQNKLLFKRNIRNHLTNNSILNEDEVILDF